MVGASAAVAAEVAVAVLLYGGDGFIRSLTTILAVLGFAFAGGMWTAPTGGPGLVDRLRRRWLLCLFAFLAAAVFGTAWSLFSGLGEERYGQALGLALLGALPLYASGTVIGGMSAAAATDIGHRLRGPGAAAAAGAAIGVILTGILLPRAPMPASLLVACLMMLSLGGMVFGAVLGARTEVDVLARRPGPSDEVRVEERRGPDADAAMLELREGLHLRRHRSLDGVGQAPWDVALMRALMPEEEAEWRVLLVGGGCSGVVRALLREHPLGTIDVLERSAAAIELGREYFQTELTLGREERVSVVVGNLDDRIAELVYGYHFVVLDTAALGPLGGLRGLSATSRESLFGLLTPGGIVATGPIGPEPTIEELPHGWTRVVLRQIEAPGGATEIVTISAREGVLERLPSVDGFVVAEDLRPASAPSAAGIDSSSPSTESTSSSEPISSSESIASSGSAPSSEESPAR